MSSASRRDAGKFLPPAGFLYQPSYDRYVDKSTNKEAHRIFYLRKFTQDGKSLASFEFGVRVLAIEKIYADATKLPKQYRSDQTTLGASVSNFTRMRDGFIRSEELATALGRVAIEGWLANYAHPLWARANSLDGVLEVLSSDEGAKYSSSTWSRVLKVVIALMLKKERAESIISYVNKEAPNLKFESEGFYIPDFLSALKEISPEIRDVVSLQGH